jgi:hypothetical protein
MRTALSIQTGVGVLEDILQVSVLDWPLCHDSEYKRFFLCSAEQVVPLVCLCVILPESRRIYGENTEKTNKKEKLMNDRCI